MSPDEKCISCGVSLALLDVRGAVYCAGCARYTMTPKEAPAGVAVTREHREATAKAHYGKIWAHLSVIQWRDTGVQNGGISDEMVRISQAIAEAELRGAQSSAAELTRLREEVARLERELSLVARDEGGALVRQAAWNAACAFEESANKRMATDAQKLSELWVINERLEGQLVEVAGLKSDLELSRSARTMLAADMNRLANGEAVVLDIADRVRHRIDLLRQRNVELENELAELKSVTDEQLAADLDLVREVYTECACEYEFRPASKHHEALARITKALAARGTR